MSWETTVGGVGRPQELINEELKQCDYAVFVLYDRWGSPTGSCHTSGTEEEWALANELHSEKRIRNIALFFKTVEPSRLNDPGPQLEAVIAFKEDVEKSRQHLFKQYDVVDHFADALDGVLARWLLDHKKLVSDSSTNRFGLYGEILNSSSVLPVNSMETWGNCAGESTLEAPRFFRYWMTQAIRSLDSNTPNYGAALFCAEKATDSAGSEIEWASARNAWARAQIGLGKPGVAVAEFAKIAEKFS